MSNVANGRKKRVKARGRELTNPIHIARLKNLKTLIDKRYAGNATEFSRTIKRSHTFLWQLMHEYRAIGEDTARMIEKTLGLPLNELDKRDITERSTSIVANMGDGATKEYRMAPCLDLDDLAKPASTWRPFPSPADRVSDDVFCVIIDTNSIEGFRKGDIAFADRKNTKLEDEAFFVVQFKMDTKGAAMLWAKKESTSQWTFTKSLVTPRRAPATFISYSHKDVNVVARVIDIVRHL